jgi:hypothetical protein
VQAIALELVEGPTIADRIAQGRIPLVAVSQESEGAYRASTYAHARTPD